MQTKGFQKWLFPHYGWGGWWSCNSSLATISSSAINGGDIGIVDTSIEGWCPQLVRGENLIHLREGNSDVSPRKPSWFIKHDRTSDFNISEHTMIKAWVLLVEAKTGQHERFNLYCRCFYCHNSMYRSIKRGVAVYIILCKFARKNGVENGKI